VLAGEPPRGLISTGSETLREVPFVSCRGRPYLKSSVSRQMGDCLKFELPRVLPVRTRFSVRR
jgi:hypothetical protein